MVKAFVGSGGKTTLIRKQALEYHRQGHKVFVTTATHMFIEEHTLLTDSANEIIRALETRGCVMAGIPAGEKIGALSPKTYQAVCRHADVVLVEADGSKGLPIKFPNNSEPVIYGNVDEIIVVCGLHALGKRACDAAHRLELVKQCLRISDDTVITAEHIQKLVMEGYVKPLREKYPDKPITIHPTHDGSPEQKTIARLIAAETDLS